MKLFRRDLAKVFAGGALASLPSTLVETPESFGAKGNGRDDDVEAFQRLSTWLTEQPGRQVVMRGIYRIGRRRMPSHEDWNREGALTIRNPSDVTIKFERGSAIIMDNLNSDGVGDQFHGIFVEGPGRGLSLINPTVMWLVKPASRSAGDGLRLHGRPDSSGSLRDIAITNCTVFRAPQAGCILVGCSNVQISALVAHDTGADGLHVNASRNVEVGKVIGINTGDDTCAFVNYFTPKPGGIYGNDYTNPWGFPSFGEFSNENSFVDQVYSIGGRASGLRLTQSTNVFINSLIVHQKEQGLILDGGHKGSMFEWSTLEPRNCVVRSGIITGCSIGMHARSFNSDMRLLEDSERDFVRMSVKIDFLQINDCKQSFVIHDVAGLVLRETNVQGGGVVIRNILDCDIGILVLQCSTPSYIDQQSLAQIKTVLRIGATEILNQ